MGQQLIIQTAFPGDLLLSIPLLKQIRVHFPNDEIVLLCRSGLGDLFLRERLADEVIEVNKKEKVSLRAGLKELRSRKWERIFCPHESYRSALWVASMKTREFSVGFKKVWNAWAFTARVDKPKRLPDALRQLSLLLPVSRNFQDQWRRDVNESAFGRPFPRTTFSFLSESAIPEWASMTVPGERSDESTVFIAPGSVWPTKMWTEKGFSEIAKKLSGNGVDVVFVGSPAEKELCERLAGATGARSLAGQTTIPELIDHFRKGRALIANDSGAMHAASVAGLPTVSVFGPTVLEFGFRPWQNRAAVAQIDLKCRPCAAHGSKRCPIGTHACMEKLPVSEVEQALDAILRPTLSR